MGPIMHLDNLSSWLCYSSPTLLLPLFPWLPYHYLTDTMDILLHLHLYLLELQPYYVATFDYLFVLEGVLY